MDKFIPEFPPVWDKFMNQGVLEADGLSPVIARSWERSLGYQVDPYHISSNSILEGDYLKERMEQWGEMLDAAGPFMEDLYIGIKGLGYTVILTDSQGYILHSLGDPDFVAKAQQVWLSTGANWSESIKGTNAIGTALHEGKAVNVFAWEHFCRENHFLACSAAPIFNHRQELLGVLDVTGDYRGADVRFLNLVKVAVNGIQREMTVRHLVGELKVSREKSRAVGELVSQGLLTFDQQGLIREVNALGSKILGLPANECIGRPLEEILKSRVLVAVKGSFPGNDSPTGKNVSANAISPVGVRYTFESILGHSPALQKTIDRAKRASQSGSTVLLTGETGTGKELFAQAIHHASGRQGSFIAINCAAIPDELIESELFGYEAGAFTGAKQKGSAGKFELANGGTIFLDEIGDMPLGLQVALLRVLQEKQVVRVGGQKIIPVDVRVIAATHQDLAQKVREGKFRQDLYYRLNVINIEIPPLRKRGDDIVLLAKIFLEKFSSRLGRPHLALAPEALPLLMGYDWPGNIRELENLIEGLVNTVEGPLITPGDLPPGIRNAVALSPPEGPVISMGAAPGKFVTAEESLGLNSQPQGSKGIPVGPENAGSARLSLKELEAAAIREAIRKCGHNISLAARTLGIGRTTLYRKMKEYKLV